MDSRGSLGRRLARRASSKVLEEGCYEQWVVKMDGTTQVENPGTLEDNHDFVEGK